MADAPASYPPPADFQRRAHVGSMEAYEQMYRRSIDDNEAFWAEQAERIDWFEPFDTVREVSFDPNDVHIRWYVGGTTNACYNCVDRHVEAGHGDRVALIFEPDEPSEEARPITYAEVQDAVARLANVLKAHGVKKGDRVTLYLPMIPEAAYAMLACARIGAVHSVVFAGFSPDALASRILDCDSTFVVTADEGRRGGKRVALKENVDRALDQCPDVRTVLVVQNTGADVHWNDDVDVWLHDALDAVSAHCPCEAMDAEAPLFILYTSGSTGKPRASSTPRRATSSTPRSRTNSSSTTTRATCTGARPMSAGLRATRTSSTARSRTGPRRFSSKGSRPTPTRAGTGRSSAATA